MSTYREPEKLRTGRTQFVKWTTEGTVKGRNSKPSIL